MANEAEQVFVGTLLNTLSTQPVTYTDDYQQPPQNFLKRIPVLPIEIPSPPRKGDVPTLAASINITFKSLKPSQSFTLTVQPTDAVSDIKSQLASQPRAPPADAQRLLLKGKALADSKLLKEYNAKDGDTINLMVKPGFEWDPSKFMDSSSSSSKVGSVLQVVVETMPTPVCSQPTLDTTMRKHQRIPSVILTPSPSPTTEKPVDIPLTLDTLSTSSISGEELSSYHTVLAKPGFWRSFRDFLCSEFIDDGDVSQAFEDFLCASKGTLTAFEIAKIRDELGVIGMAGR